MRTRDTVRGAGIAPAAVTHVHEVLHVHRQDSALTTLPCLYIKMGAFGVNL